MAAGTRGLALASRRGFSDISGFEIGGFKASHCRQLAWGGGRATGSVNFFGKLNLPDTVIAMNQNTLTRVITEDINADFGRAEYLGQKVVIMRKNGFVNMTKLCDQKNRKFGNWLENKTSKELVRAVATSSGIPDDETMILVKGGQTPETRGTYVHHRLAPHIASWISPEFGLIVSDIVTDHHIRKLAEQEGTIAQLTEKINSMLSGMQVL